MHIDETFDFPPVDRDALLRALRASVPAGQVLSKPEELKPYECDGLSAYHQIPRVVVLSVL